MRSRYHRYIWAGATLWMSAACGGSQRAPGVAAGQAGSSAADPAAARGMGVQPATSAATPVASVASDRPAAASAGPPSPAAPGASFVLETRLHARRVQNGRSITFDELHSGDTVMDGDRLQLSVRTSKAAYLYLAFCSKHADDPRHQGLSIFPESGSIRMNANETMTVPARTGEIVLDDKPGRETLYLILSQAELAHADSGLADVIDAARRGRNTVDCGAPLRTTVATPTRKPNLSPSSGGGKLSSAAPPPVLTPAPPPARPATPGTEKPVVDIERDGKIVLADGPEPGVAADPDGIVILRYELEHEPAPPPTSPAGTASLP